MFFHADIKGNRLPPKTLCLTYDDGPGPRTLSLGRFLREVQVQATFFALGRHAEQQPGVVEQLAEWGHLIGNHTHTHPGLVKFALEGGDVVGELSRADQALLPVRTDSATFFRAPYGNWRETEYPDGPDKPVSIVAEILNQSDLAERYVGPVNWDICAEDWTYWEGRQPAEECAAAYLSAIEEHGRGIVLMHDSSIDPVARAGNQVDEVAWMLVPALLARGYRFVRLDEIPQVRAAAAAGRAAQP